MIKKTIGIATILLAILVIGIGIAKANTRTALLDKHDLPDLALTQLTDAQEGLLLTDLSPANLPLTPVLGELHDLSELDTLDELDTLGDLDLPAEDLKDLSKRVALLNALPADAPLDVTPVQLHPDLGLLALSR